AISGSDAHYPEHIGRRPTIIAMPEEGVGALRTALANFAAIVAGFGAKDEGGEPKGEFGGYAELLADPRLEAYPASEAEAFFEDVRRALRAGKLEPTHLAKPLV
ncbi:MAG: hypothetical protein ACYC1A_10105, partial [Spirochaetales bacterium]